MSEQEPETQHSITRQLTADEPWPRSFEETLKEIDETKQQYLDRVRPQNIVKPREPKQEILRLFTADAVVDKTAQPFIEITSNKLVKFDKVKVILYGVESEN